MRGELWAIDEFVSGIVLSNVCFGWKYARPTRSKDLLVVQPAFFRRTDDHGHRVYVFAALLKYTLSPFSIF